MTTAIIVLSVASLALLGACAWMWRDRSRLTRERDIAELDRSNLAKLSDSLTDRLDAQQRRERDLAVEAATLRERVDAHEKRRQEDAEQRARLFEQFQHTFDALAAKALDASSAQFLKLAKESFAAEHEKARAELEQRRAAVDQLVKPIGETLRKTDEKLAAMAQERAATHAELKEQVRAMLESGRTLRDETGKLTRALRKPQVRGRYGEIQLERVAELAGMRPYCDFSTQESVRDGDHNLLRPDMVVRLPNGRVVLVDAKCNIEAYLDAIEADTPEQAEQCLERFARHVYDQAGALAKKEYQNVVDGSAEFVVMFVPGDQFVDAALERRPDLLDFAADHGVIIASPSTLIGLLRAVHIGWREKQLSESAQELFALGKELHERAVVALDHASRVGDAIERARESYNRFVGSVDGRLMPTLRRFEDKGAKSSRALEDLKPIEGDTRAIQALDGAPSAEPAERPALSVTTRPASDAPARADA